MLQLYSMLIKIKHYLKYSKELLNLASPIIMGNIGTVLIGVGDVLVAGRHSTDTLASISIANAIMTCIFMFGLGLLLGISPILANFRGKRQNAKRYFIPTIKYSMLIAAVSTITILLSVPLIPHLGFETHLVANIQKYMMICAFSTFGAYLHCGLKEFLQAFEIVFFANFVIMLGVVLNVIFNFILVFGLFGFPELGPIGLAISTFSIRTFMGLALLLYCLSFIKPRPYFPKKYFGRLVKVSLPISFSLLMEFLAFNFVTIMMGRISGLYAGANTIILTITGMTFMIPLALSNAIAVKVGFANGAGNFKDLRTYAYVGSFISFVFMTFCALLFILFPVSIVKIFTSDVRLIEICTPVFLFVAIYQVFDGLQIAFGGVFKGLKQTNVVMINTFIAYWLIGLPLGYVLATTYGLNLSGYWIGISLALIYLAIVFTVLLVRKFKMLR